MGRQKRSAPDGTADPAPAQPRLAGAADVITTGECLLRDGHRAADGDADPGAETALHRALDTPDRLRPAGLAAGPAAAGHRPWHVDARHVARDERRRLRRLSAGIATGADPR